MYCHFPAVICGTGHSWMGSPREGLQRGPSADRARRPPSVGRQELLRETRGVSASGKSDPRADRQQLEFLAAITTEYEGKLRDVLREEAEAQAARERELLELLTAISTRHEQELRDLPRAEAEARRESELMEFVRAISTPTYEDGWNPALHPRTGTPPNPGWWASTDGDGSEGGTPVRPTGDFSPPTPSQAQRRGPANGPMRPDRGVKRSSDDFRRSDWELRAARAYLTNYQTSDSVSNSIIRLAAEGDVDGIVSLIDTGGLNAAQQALAKSLLQRLRSTAQQIIAKECQASIHRKFPRELYSTRLKDIIQMAKRGDDAARRALKLLNDKRFKKGR